MDQTKSVKDIVCSFENLYRAMMVCKNGVIWKDSVAGFVKNGLSNCIKLHDDLMNNTYKLQPYSVFEISEPKHRIVTATQFRDRIVQRSLCDNYLSAELSRSFIYDNCACLHGKGTSWARNRYKAHLQKYYRGHRIEGYILKCDIHDYFGSTPHSIASQAIHKRVRDEWACQFLDMIINSYINGPNPHLGLGIGSQVTQLIQLAVLDDLDHLIKEKLKIKHYIRYMDDFILLHEDKGYLRECRRVIADQLSYIGLQLSETKTQLLKITDSVKFLGFMFRLTETGHVIMKLDHSKISHERRKLSKLVNLAESGILAKDKVDQCYTSFKAHANQGDCYHLLLQMDDYYNKLITGGVSNV